MKPRTALVAKSPVAQGCDALVVASLFIDEMSRILADGSKDFLAAFRIVYRLRCHSLNAQRDRLLALQNYAWS